MESCITEVKGREGQRGEVASSSQMLSPAESEARGIHLGRLPEKVSPESARNCCEPQNMSFVERRLQGPCGSELRARRCQQARREGGGFQRLLPDLHKHCCFDWQWGLVYFFQGGTTSVMCRFILEHDTMGRATISGFTFPTSPGETHRFTHTLGHRK